VPKIVHTVHGLAFHPFQSHLENYSYRCLEWLAGLVTDRMVFVGDVMRRASIRARMTTGARARIVFSGIEVDAFMNGRAAESGRTTIAMIARLAPLKGHRELLEAFEKLVSRGLDVELLLIGDGGLRMELESWVRERRLSGRVTFTGLVSPEEIPKYLKRSSIVVHTSFREGLPRACVQGLLAGLPVVAFDFDGAREVVLDGETGYLIPRADVALLADRLEHLVRNPDRAREMGRRGRELVRERFDARTMVRRLDAIYSEITV
jgi:glycosyltransferase involved in cell wall biosynthesis